jgi:hypothetical protein
MNPRVGLDAVEKRKICCRCKEPNPGRPAGSLVAIPTELSRLHATKPVAMGTGLLAESRSDNRSTGCETWSFRQSDNTDSGSLATVRSGSTALLSGGGGVREGRKEGEQGSKRN